MISRTHVQNERRPMKRQRYLARILSRFRGGKSTRDAVRFFGKREFHHAFGCRIARAKTALHNDLPHYASPTSRRIARSGRVDVHSDGHDAYVRQLRTTPTTGVERNNCSCQSDRPRARRLREMTTLRKRGDVTITVAESSFASRPDACFR